MARGPHAHLQPYLAEPEPSEGDLQVGRNPRTIPDVDWQTANLPFRTLAEAGFTHQLRRPLMDDGAGCFPLGATGDERHDRGFGIMLHGA